LDQQKKVYSAHAHTYALSKGESDEIYSASLCCVNN